MVSYDEHLREEHSYGPEHNGAGQNLPHETHSSSMPDSTHHVVGESISSETVGEKKKANALIFERIGQLVSDVTPDSVNQDHAQPRAWRTTWIRFGPLSVSNRYDSDMHTGRDGLTKANRESSPSYLP